MLMNNLDRRSPKTLISWWSTAGPAGPFAVGMPSMRSFASCESLPTTRPCWSRAVAGRGGSDPRVGTAGADRELEPCGKWATWDVFRELEQAGLMMYGQMPRIMDLHRDPGHPAGHLRDLRRSCPPALRRVMRQTVTLTAGLGGMGGAQPLAVTMNEGVCLAIEVDEARARRRLEIGYVDLLTHDPVEALGWARDAAARGDATSIALVGNAAEIEPGWAAAGERFDLVTDQTSAHDALAGYVPAEMTLADALSLRATQPEEYQRRSRSAMADHVRAMLAFQRAGRSSSTTATTSERRRPKPAWPTRSTTRGSYRRSSGRSSVRDEDRFAGPRCRATPPTSSGPTEPCWSCSLTTPVCAAGSRWPRRASRSRASCPHLLAGVRATRPGRACLQRARPDRGSRSTDRDRARSPRRRICRVAESRPRPWRTDRTRSPIGHS